MAFMFFHFFTDIKYLHLLTKSFKNTHNNPCHFGPRSFSNLKITYDYELGQFSRAKILSKHLSALDRGLLGVRERAPLKEGNTVFGAGDKKTEKSVRDTKVLSTW